MSFENYFLTSMESEQIPFDYSQNYFENYMQKENEDVKQIFKENLPTISLFRTQQFEQDTLSGLKKYCSSPASYSCKNYKKNVNEYFTTDLIKTKQQELVQMCDIKSLMILMKMLAQLETKLASIEQKSIEIESYQSDLKSKLQQNIQYFDKFSSVWLKKIIDNQMNKQILNESLESQTEIQIQKEVVIEEINQIKQEIKSCLTILKDTPIFAESYKKIILKIDENKYPNKQIKSDCQFYFTEKINSQQFFNEQYESQSDLETQDTYRSLESEVFQNESLQQQQSKQQSKFQSFRLKVAFAGVNQNSLNYYFCKQNIQSYDQKFFCDENTCLVAFTTAFVMVSQKIPGIDLISLGCLGLIQSIVNFSNPHRTLSGCLREQNVIVSQITVCGGLGLTGAAIGQALIPVPVLGALVGGLVMEFLGIYISCKIKDWCISSQQQKQSNFFAENNVEVSETNIDKFCDIMDIKKESLGDIVLPNQHLLNKLLGCEKQIETENGFGDIEKLQIYLLYTLQSIGSQLYTNNKEKLGEDAFQELSELQNHLESFTEYFDFDYLSIGKNLYEIFNQLQEKISVEDIKDIVEQIEPFNIYSNNLINQSQESIKKCCNFENLTQLLKSKNIDERIIIDYLPESIQNLYSNQKLDLWCTYICIQLLNPSFVFLDIFMMKVNFQLESKNLFFIDTIEQYFPIIKEMFEEV
ncbi:hypothetical protein ABPG74_007745 [Tetrahymena malaccensis]